MNDELKLYRSLIEGLIEDLEDIGGGELSLKVNDLEIELSMEPEKQYERASELLQAYREKPYLDLYLYGEPEAEESETQELTETGEKREDQEEAKKLVEVRSRIVGVFRNVIAPNEVIELYEGKELKKGDPLGIIEGLSFMQYLRSPIDGYLRKIYVQDEDIVEYDQLLFEIEPLQENAQVDLSDDVTLVKIKEGKTK